MRRCEVRWVYGVVDADVGATKGGRVSGRREREGRDAHAELVRRRLTSR